MSQTSVPDGEPTATLTIEQVAAEAALPVSTLRMYQHRGLLAPPEKRGRIGYYGPDHLARLRLIAELQERGFSLASIKELADGLEDGRSLNDVLGLSTEQSVWAAEEPVVVDLASLIDRFGAEDLTPELVQRVIGLGLVELTDDGQLRVMSPRFLEIGTQLGALGVPTDEIIDEYEALRAATDTIAERFTGVFERNLWEPLTADGVSPDHVAGVAASLEQLGQLAQAVVDLTLAQAIQRRAQQFLDDQAAALVGSGGRRRSAASPSTAKPKAKVTPKAKANATPKAKAKAKANATAKAEPKAEATVAPTTKPAVPAKRARSSR